MAKVNKSQFAIMGMLSVMPMSGYEIRRHMEDSTDYFWKESDGQLYPTLDRLSKEGKIVCEGVRKHGARESKVYAITDSGRAALKVWLDDPNCVMLIRSEFLLKVFFGANTTPEKIAEHIEIFYQERKRRLKILRQVQQELEEEEPSDNKFYWELCCGYADKQINALMEWCEESLEKISRKKS